MDSALTLLNQLFVILGYAVLGIVAYKLFQLNADLREIKALLQKSNRNASFNPVELGAAARGSAAPSSVAPTTVSLADGDDATEYAEKLLRSLQAEAARSENEAQKTL